MTQILHIVGQQGIGKTQLAMDIIAGLQRRGKVGVSLVEIGLQCGEAHPDLAALRAGQPIIDPDNGEAIEADVVILEHQDIPVHGKLRSGDMVIAMHVMVEGGPA